MWKLLSFHTQTISAQFLRGNVLLKEGVQIDAEYFNSEYFESARYMILLTIPLSL